MENQNENKRFVVVTTEHRGVFAGCVEDDTKLPAEITLSDAQLCVYWSKETRGVLGLAATGPNADCRIGPPVPLATLCQITGVFDATKIAEDKWRAAPWRS